MSTGTLPRRARLAREIRAELQRQDMTITELGHRIGKPQTTVSRWLHKHNPDLGDIEDLTAIAHALDVPLWRLLAAAGYDQEAWDGTERRTNVVALDPARQDRRRYATTLESECRQLVAA